MKLKDPPVERPIRHPDGSTSWPPHGHDPFAWIDPEDALWVTTVREALKTERRAYDLCFEWALAVAQENTRFRALLSTPDTQEQGK